MKTILRRVGRLEGKLASQVNAASSRAAGLLRERRRLRLEANGQPFEDLSWADMSTAPGGCLSVAETLRLCRRRRLEQSRALKEGR